ncbi:MAG: sensor histidine kinase, partial [Clostridium sp.]
TDSTSIVIGLLAFVWFMPILIFILVDFFSKKSFYTEILTLTNNLDKKYLLPEVIKRPKSYEGQIIYDVLAESNRAMHEHVNEYKIMQSEYREYMETWIHEIKTPIALTKLVAENSEGKTKTIIQNETKKIEGYVEQVLYYSRSNDVSKDYIIKEFEIKDTLNKVIRNNRYELISGKFQIDVGNVTGTVITDEKWLEFIINQIIGNAIKYKKDVNPQIKAYTTLSKDSLVLTLEDNGIGIIDKDVDRVFEKGFTGYNGRIYGKSTGIGLYLCKKLCLKLGLNITLASEYGKGTKVNLIFPLGELTNLDK